jgi:hypothetical protein
MGDTSADPGRGVLDVVHSMQTLAAFRQPIVMKLLPVIT